MKLKELFEKAENGKLSYDELDALMKEAKVKFVDLSEGNYVAKGKYEDDLKAKDDEIDMLNGTILDREDDLKSIQEQLEEAGNDSLKLNELTSQLGQLQSKYDSDVEAYRTQLAKQGYEFAVKDYASTKSFTSAAAKRDFISSMLAKELKMDGDKILGADDFTAEYTTSNADAFVVEKKEESKQPPLPKFVGNTNPQTSVGEENPFADMFHFTPLNSQK